MKLRVKFPLLIGLVVVVALGSIGYLTTFFQHELVIGQAERQARMISRQILLTRRWVADHDGMFVIKKPGTKSDSSPAGGDVIDQTGQVYVKRNPGMIIWELSGYAEQVDFCRFRVTSLRPIDPDNAPDAFERQALLDFETGKEEVSEIVNGEQGRILRYITPLKVEQSCLPCHAEHGYQVGNIRGGLSLEVPIGWADEAIDANNRLLLLVALIAIAITWLATFLLMNSLVVRRLSALAAGIDQYPRLPHSGPWPEGDDEIVDLTRKLALRGERLEASQAELALTREQMFQNEKQAAIAQLAAGIAHDVNNPLNSMREGLNNLRAAPGDLELHDRCLELFDKGLLRIGHVTRKLMNSGRDSSLNPEQVSIDGLIRDCFELLAFQLRGIRLKLDLAVVNQYCLDGGVLKQALVNVAMNAIQAMPSGGDILVVSREEAGLLVISVRDSGAGIPDGDLERIFEPFFTTREMGQGRGLGLSVAGSLINRLGGRIRVESQPGEGAIFTIELPRQPAAEAGAL